MKPHVHAELIKAWADGEQIENRTVDGRWVDCSDPSWFADTEYRIKPEPSPDLHHYYNVSSRNGIIFMGYRECSYNPHNLKLTFDGETGKLKKAKVVS